MDILLIKIRKEQYRFPGLCVSIDHVQGDPFASPSKVSIHVEGKAAAFPSDLYCGKISGSRFRMN